MTCPVDALKWGEKNRVSLATGKRQKWVIARTSRDNPTIESVPQTAKAVLVKWFAGIPLDVMFADAGDAVDGIEVTAVGSSMPAPVRGAERREGLDPVPVLASGKAPPLFVTVEFNYRGYEKSLPWPVWTSAQWSVLRESKLCPMECDWMLAWAAPAAALAPAPEEASLLDKLSHNGPGLLSDAAALVQFAGYGLVLYVGWQALSVVLPTLRPLRLSSQRRRAS